MPVDSVPGANKDTYDQLMKREDESAFLWGKAL